MTSTALTPADFCQGHGGGRECTYDADFGYCQHGDDFDHGVISYCDGTCHEARQQWAAEIRRTTGHFPTASTITLEVWGTGLSYRVTFATEGQALTYLAAHPDRGFGEIEDGILPEGLTRLRDALYPSCEHGMSAINCYGPDHWMSRDQEMALGL